MSTSNPNPASNRTPDPNLIHQGRLDAFLTNAVDAIITIDQRGIIESANPATQLMFGYSDEEMVGQNIKILMPNPFHDQHDQYLKNYLSTGVRKIIGIGREVTAKRKNGTVFPIHLAVSEIRHDERSIFTGVIRDISDLKSVEAKLVQSERLAAIGQMVAGLAHESRNAFQRSHACLANLALDVDGMPDSLSLVHKVQNALDHLNSLLDEVRDYAAPIVLEKSLTDVECLIRETWNQICDVAPAAEAIEFTIDRSDDFQVKLKIDRRRFGQVFFNLLENARVACQTSSQNKAAVSVKLQTIFDADDQHLHCIDITDSGGGIAAENVDSLFEPFFTTKTKGTGLGLAICQRIIDAHQGSINATNTPAGGANFRIALPEIKT